MSGLTVRHDLNRKLLSDIKTDINAQGDLAGFENQPIRTVIVRNWPNESFLYTLFHRLNSGSVPLSPQELRQALHPGPFLEYIKAFTNDQNAVHFAMDIEGPDFRMRDVELGIRFLGFRLFLNQYDGNLKDFLDSVCSKLNMHWQSYEGVVDSAMTELQHGILTTFELFGGDAFRRWQNGKFENRFNRAVFDIMLYYFSQRPIWDLARKNSDAIKQAFCKLCDDNEEFAASLRSTTKSLSATGTRLTLWGERLNLLLNAQLVIPRLDGGRIRA